MTKLKKKDKQEFNREYERTLKHFEFIDPGTGEEKKVPVCFESRENCVRKPVKLEEIHENIVKATNCSVCDFLESCSSGTLIDCHDQQLMFLRMLNSKLDIVINIMRVQCTLMESANKINSQIRIKP
jgi:hypothetical protein